MLLLTATTILCANLFASYVLATSDLATRAQKRSQLVFLWLMPIIGAVLVWLIHRSVLPPLSKYRSRQESRGENMMEMRAMFTDQQRNNW